VAGATKPTHSDQEPGYPAIAMLHAERAAAAAREAELQRQLDETRRRTSRLADEVETLSGRAVRAERALIAYRTPGIALPPAGSAPTMESEAVR
jgi:hypothetical protein